MASKRRESEGIALLSMYADDDDDDREEEHQQQQPTHPQNDTVSQFPPNDAVNDPIDNMKATITSDQVVNYEYTTGDVRVEGSNAVSKNFTEILTVNAVRNEVSTQRVASERLTIVDYGHDEAALSPEPEEGEREETGRVMFGADLHMYNDYLLQTKSRLSSDYSGLR